jgi:hypothetical protein
MCVCNTVLEFGLLVVLVIGRTHAHLSVVDAPHPPEGTIKITVADGLVEAAPPTCRRRRLCLGDLSTIRTRVRYNQPKARSHNDPPHATTTFSTNECKHGFHNPRRHRCKSPTAVARAQTHPKPSPNHPRPKQNPTEPSKNQPEHRQTRQNWPQPKPLTPNKSRSNLEQPVIHTARCYIEKFAARGPSAERGSQHEHDQTREYDRITDAIKEPLDTSM